MNTPIHSSQQDFIPAAVAMASAAESTATNAWLSDYRTAKRAQLETATFPHKRIEHFKYNRLNAFDDNTFCTHASSSAHQLDTTSRDIEGLCSAADDRIVFINGHLSLAHCVLGAHSITTFTDANAAQQEKILAQLHKQAIDHNPFSLLSASLVDNGILIEIDANSPESLIEILYITDPDIHASTLASHVVIDVADNCQGTIVSRSINWDFTSSNVNLHTQQTLANIGEHATLTHYCLQLDNVNTVFFSNSEYNLQSHAILKAFYGATGSILKKMDITVNHLGQHGHAFLNGLYAATDAQQIDYHTTINHPYANGQTDEVFRGIVNGQAEATFNGRIHIFEDAQKTRAELSNKNLVLSDEAQMHTKPELEIYADDVVCAHGATVSRMNDEFIAYLQARGIAKPEAELMLSYGFFNEILDELEHEAIADFLRPILFKRFA